MPVSEASLPEDVSPPASPNPLDDIIEARPVYFAASIPEGPGIDYLGEPGQVPVGASALDPRSSGFVMLDEFSSPEQSSEMSGGDDEPAESHSEPVDMAGETVERLAIAPEPQEAHAPQGDSLSTHDEAQDDMSLGMFDGIISDVLPDSQESDDVRSRQEAMEFSLGAVKSALLRQVRGEDTQEREESEESEEREVNADQVFPGMAISQEQKGHVPGSWAMLDEELDADGSNQPVDASRTMFGFQGLVRPSPVQAQAPRMQDDDSEPEFILQEEIKEVWSGPGSGMGRSIAEDSSIADFERAETVANAAPLNFMRDAQASTSAISSEGVHALSEHTVEESFQEASEDLGEESFRGTLRMPRLQPESGGRKGLEENTRPGDASSKEQEEDTSASSQQLNSNRTMGFGSPMASGLINDLRAHRRGNKPLPRDTCETFELTLSEIWQMRLAERKPAMQIFKRRRSQGTYRSQELLDSHHDQIQEVVYCEQGKFFAVSGSEPVVELWSPTRGRIGCLSSSDPIECINVTLDGRVIVAGCASGTLHVWLLPSSLRSIGEASIGKVTLKGTSATNCVSFDIHGRYVMAGFNDGNTIIWDMADGREHSRLLHHSGGVLAMDFDSNGPITSCEDNILRFWSMDAQVQGLIGGVGQLVSLKADARGLYGLSVNGLLHHYQDNEHRETYTFDQHPVGFALSSDGMLAVAGERGAVSIYPKGLDSSPQVIDLGQDLSAVAASGSLVVIGTKEGSLEILKRQ